MLGPRVLSDQLGDGGWESAFLMFVSPLREISVMFINIQQIDIEGVKEFILLLDSAEVNVFIVQMRPHPNAELTAKLMVFKGLVRFLSRTETAIRSDTLKGWMTDIKQFLESSVTTSGFTCLTHT